MSREWKPGDVALVDSWRGKGQIAFRCERVKGEPNWCVMDGTDTRGLDDSEITLARPVVVIDPEDREQVKRLTETYYGALRDSPYKSLPDAMQAALREFADPKPEEPTDPKARVTDRRENIWRLLADGDWVCTSGPDIGEYLTWSRLADDYGPLTIEAA